MIRIENLKKRYTSDFTLDIPALSIAPGERVALIGPNGSGKSTLLRILAGVLKPEEGKIGISVPEKDTGYQPQNPYVFRGTVEKNLRLGMRGDEDIAALLEECELTALKDKRADRLSGGERQRLCLARMLAGNYKLLLLDEPLSAADIETGERLSLLLKRYCENTGATLVMSTHLPVQAQQIATKHLILHKGQVAEYGDAATLSAPESEFGKRFLSQWKI